MYERAQLPGLLGQTPGYPAGLNGTFELAIDLPTSADADRMYAQVIAAGAQPVYTPRDEPWGMHSSMIADPEGNLIEIGSWNGIDDASTRSDWTLAAALCHNRTATLGVRGQSRGTP